MGDGHHDEDRRPTATPHEWAGLIRRADIKLERKGAAFVFASYADTGTENGQIPGEHIHCGVARYAADLRKSLSTAKRYLSWLRESGLIELTAKGNARRMLADEYRLILITPEQADALGILDPTAYKEMIGEIARRNREAGARSRRSIRAHSDEPRTGDNSAVHQKQSGLTKDEPRTADQGSFSRASGLTQDEPPPNLDNTEPMFLTEPEMVDLRTDLTVTRARGPNGGGFAAQMDVEPPAGDRHQCPSGIGWCVDCYAQLGQAVLAVDSVFGSHCRTHMRAITAQPIEAA